MGLEYWSVEKRREYMREYARKRRLNPEYVKKERARDRARYWKKKGVVLDEE